MLALGGLLTSVNSVRAGEKIQITDSPEKVNLPKDLAPLPSESYRRAIPSGDSGPGTVFPQPNQPMVIPNRKLEDMIEQKKNWIFRSPNAVDQDRFEEAFGVRKYELNSLGKAQKSSQERYFEAGDDRKDGRPAKDALGRDTARGKRDLDSTGRFSRENEGEDQPGIIQELNPAPLFNWTSPSDASSPMNSMFKGRSIIPSGLDQPGFGDRGPAQPVRDNNPSQNSFQKAWDMRRAPLGKFADPINDPGDATRSFMNPIAARKASIPPPGASSGQLDGLFPTGANSPSAARSESFAPIGDRKWGTPTIIPAAASPSIPRPLIKPSVLEIPRAKF